MMRRRLFTISLTTLSLYTGLLQAGSLPARYYEEPPKKPRIQEFNLHDDNDRVPPDLALIRESERSFNTGEKLLEAGRIREAREQFGLAFDSFFYSGYDGDDTLIRAHFLELIQRADVFRQTLDIFNEPEQDQTTRFQEVSPIEDLLAQETIPTIVDPNIEHLIQEDILNQKYDIPVTINRQVLSVVHYLTNGRKKRDIDIGFQRLERYKDLFKRIFHEEGLPEDLLYLGLVESNYNPFAYSSAKAKGIWQFVEDTGRRYGLHVDYWVDERCDPEKSTRAACRYMKDMYQMFSDWYLVLAGYNWGEGRIVRILNQSPEKTYWDMCTTGAMPRETQGYVPALLAAVIIGKNPDRFGIAPEPSSPLNYVTVEIPSPTDLRVVADVLGVSLESLQELNPSLRRSVTPPYLKTFPIKVPVDTPIDALVQLYDLPYQKRLNTVEHVVAAGETLPKIAKRYGVSVNTLRDINNIAGKHPTVHEGQTVLVPLAHILPGSSGEDEETSTQVQHYKVRKGDTLASVARHFGVRTDDLKKWNRIGKHGIKPGSTLRIEKEVAEPRMAELSSQEDASSRDRTYTVRRGDTATSIAAKFGVEREALLAANGLPSRTQLHRKQVLRIPSAAAASDQTAETARPAPVRPKEDMTPPEIRQAAVPRTREAEPSATARKPQTYKVKRGDTLSSIADKYGLDVDQLLEANGLGRKAAIKAGEKLKIPGNTPAPVREAAAPSARSTSRDGSYTVQPGDTVFSIARAHGLDPAELKTANRLSAKAHLKAGQQLVLPGASSDAVSARPRAAREERSETKSYTVHKGDTLGSIARKLDVSEADLREANSLSPKARIKAGQELQLPSPARASAPSDREEPRRGSSQSSAYEVKAKDTPAAIARRLGVSLDDLLQANGMSKSSLLQVGQQLNVPVRGGNAHRSEAAAPPAVRAERSHTVKAGDTPAEIAKSNGVDLQDLLKANNLSKKSKLQIGQKLVIPGAEKASGPTRTSKTQNGKKHKSSKG